MTDTIPVGAAPNGVAVAPDGVWVTDEVGGTLVHLDRASRETAVTTLGGRPEGVTLADGSLWIAVQAGGAAHRGGTLRMVPQREPIDSIDPARAYAPLDVAAPLGGVRRARRLQARRRHRREHARTRPRERASGTDRQRQDIHVPAARGHQVRRRPRAQGICRPLLARAAVQSEPGAARLLRRHRRRARMPEATRAMRPVQGRRDRRRHGDRHDQAARAGPRVSLQAGAAVRVSRPDRHTRYG